MTGQGASSLRRRPSNPFPLSELIVLYKYDDIRAWLLVNPGKDPLDLLVLEARLGLDGNRDVTPQVPLGDTHFLTENSGIAQGKCTIQGKKIPTTIRA